MPEITIVEFQPTWAEEFRTIANSIRTIAGQGVLRIDHIGSTAVAGLSAKDVIDIQITVSQLANCECVQNLQDNGYNFRSHITHDLLVGLDSDSVELQKQFFRERPSDRRANIHVREEGRVNQIYPLLFRDYLRADSAVREAYSTVKKELAKKFANDTDSYYAIKDPYMDTVYQAAKLWSRLNDWSPDNEFV